MKNNVVNGPYHWDELRAEMNRLPLKLRQEIIEGDPHRPTSKNINQAATICDISERNKHDF